MLCVVMNEEEEEEEEEGDCRDGEEEERRCRMSAGQQYVPMQCRCDRACVDKRVTDRSSEECPSEREKKRTSEATRQECKETGKTLRAAKP